MSFKAVVSQEVYFKARLEARMGVLEEHNRQLEAQLIRLKELIEEVLYGHKN